MKRILMTTTALVFGFCAQANAGTFEEAALDTFQEQGYSNIDVSTSGNRVNVQAVKEGVVVDITYDSDTGAVISQDASYADDNDGHDSNDSHDSSDDDGRGTVTVMVTTAMAMMATAEIATATATAETATVTATVGDSDSDGDSDGDD